ncbi:adenylosuccinate lyase [bacterium DOLZORAL124_38_8]|nr:MAG: adenylosuccinate lyase [bacterium DOLZORAL124_38_8]
MFLSPLDGRYASRVAEVAPIFSEFGLTKYRTQVEVEWLIFLSDKNIAPSLSAQQITELRALIENFSDTEFNAIKDIEKTTNHDVKAVEVFLQSKTEARFHPFIHFGCTSEDINSTSYALTLRDGMETVLDIFENEILADLKAKALDWKAVPMLSRTHGQTATPVTVGKEMAVFYKRMKDLINHTNLFFSAKFAGATGNFAAHKESFPTEDWINLSEEFVTERLNLTWNPLTTQIEPHDNQAKTMNLLSQLSTVMIDLCRDMWGYISLGYFGQKVVAGEVGSSTMPHKVNPIDFENAEGNLKLARGLARTLADELPISRWQRDLTDSTVQRNFGIVFGHFLLAVRSLKKGLGKVELKPAVLLEDLQNAPEVLTEAVQMVMRAHGHADAYNQLKAFSRGRALNLEEVREFIGTIDIPAEAKERLINLTPETYTGESEKLVDLFVE